MGLQGEDAERTENGVVAVKPEPSKGLTSKVIDWLEWLSVKLMHDSKQPLHYLSGNFAPVEETPPLKDLPVIGHLPEHLNGEFVRLVLTPSFLQLQDFIGLMEMVAYLSFMVHLLG